MFTMAFAQKMFVSFFSKFGVMVEMTREKWQPDF